MNIKKRKTILNRKRSNFRWRALIDINLTVTDLSDILAMPVIRHPEIEYSGFYYPGLLYAK